MRHFAIYAVKWPSRLPTDGTPAFLPTPRDNRSMTPAYASTARVSHAALATLNHKLSHAASGSRSASASVSHNPHKRQRTVEEEPEAPPLKRQKLQNVKKQRGRPPKNKVGMSSKAKQMLGVNERRSERTRRPSAKLRESEPPPKIKPDTPSSSSKAPVSSTSTSSAASAGTDSSLLSTRAEGEAAGASGEGNLPATPATPVVVKREVVKLPTPKSLAVAAQPRESNGRFGKKESTNGRYMRKNFQFTPGGRRLARGRKPKPGPKLPTGPVVKIEPDSSAAHAVPAPSSPSQKRNHDDAEGTEDERAKRQRVEAVEVRVEVKIEGEEADLSGASLEDDASQDEEEQFFRRPRMTVAKGGMGFLSRPNPLNFARRKWTSVPPEDPPEIPAATSSYGPHSSTDDDADLPVTPQDDVETQPVVAVDEGELSDEYDDYDDYEDDDKSDGTPERVTFRPALSMGMGRKPGGFAGPMTFKPSPFNLARRRWGPSPSAAATPGPDEAPYSADPLNAPSGSSLPSFTDLFEADGEDPDDAPAERVSEAAAPGSVDPDVSSEEVSSRALLSPQALA